MRSRRGAVMLPAEGLWGKYRQNEKEWHKGERGETLDNFFPEPAVTPFFFPEDHVIILNLRTKAALGL